MAHPIIDGDQVWCPLCKEHVQLLKIKKAARIADVSPKTIYRYVEEGKVYSVKIGWWDGSGFHSDGSAGIDFLCDVIGVLAPTNLKAPLSRGDNLWSRV